jgi:hypothetical protein
MQVESGEGVSVDEPRKSEKEISAPLDSLVFLKREEVFGIVSSSVSRRQSLLPSPILPSNLKVTHNINFWQKEL